MMKNTIATMCILMSIVGMGCTKSSGTRNFSHQFNGKKADAAAKALDMYNTVCRELESRNFKQMDITEGPEETRVLYEGQSDGYLVMVRIRRLTAFSEEEPEFSYRVSFEETEDIAGLDEAAEALRTLMRNWCDEVL